MLLAYPHKKQSHSVIRDSNDFIFQRDGAPFHWHLLVRAYLNKNVPQRWIGRRAAKDLVLCALPVRFPDLTVCDINHNFS